MKENQWNSFSRITFLGKKGEEKGGDSIWSMQASAGNKGQEIFMEMLSHFFLLGLIDIGYDGHDIPV